MTGEFFFTLAELARLYKCSESYLYKAVARHDLRPTRIGNRLRIPVREAERFAGLPAGTLSREIRSGEAR